MHISVGGMFHYGLKTYKMIFFFFMKLNYVPREREGEHTVFGADPVCVDFSVSVSVGVSVAFILCAQYHMNRLADFIHICTNTTMGHDEELDRF